jgi:prolyl-tRNA synthetase
MRCREFIMKDLYSFDIDEAAHLAFYEKAKTAYKNVFQRAGIGHLTYMTFASGGMFSKFSHEYQTITGAGEDTIYIDESKGVALNKEVYTDEVIESLGLSKESLVEQRAVEVGNIFTLGTRFSDALDLKYQTEDGENKSVFMGSYGIGPGRLMGTIVEVLSDDKGIIWPEEVAPFKVHILALGAGTETGAAALAKAKELHDMFAENGIEALFDDREGLSAGEKFADADLLGMPYRIVVSERSLKEGGYEVKRRTEEKGKIVILEEVLSFLK